MAVNIVFERQSRQYNAGDTVRGDVLLTHLVKEIQVLVRGKGKVGWIESLKASKYNKSHNKEVYFQKNIYLKPNGQLKFPFSFDLPRDLPESYYSLNGSVEYKVNFTVISLGSPENKTENKCIITVHALVPIPLSLKEPLTEEGTKHMQKSSIFCCCFSSGTVNVKMVTNKGGYMQNEPIQLKAEISNHSYSQMDVITLSIKQERVYTAKYGKTLVIMEKIGSKYILGRGLRAHDRLVWQKTTTISSRYPPTNLGTCKIIQISYFLELKIGDHSGYCPQDLHFRVPIMLGSAA